MKSGIGILLILITSITLTGCSTDEVLRVGTPVNDNGTEVVKIHKEITNSESIEALRRIVDKVKDIEKPQDLNKEPKTFFYLTDPRIAHLKYDGMSGIKTMVVQFYLMV